LLLAVTIAGTALSYEAVRRIGWLRPLFGLKAQQQSVRNERLETA
jgi:hypothetical protein